VPMARRSTSERSSSSNRAATQRSTASTPPMHARQDAPCRIWGAGAMSRCSEAKAAPALEGGSGHQRYGCPPAASVGPGEAIERQGGRWPILASRSRSGGRRTAASP
jgi:hypothetical protein